MLNIGAPKRCRNAEAADSIELCTVAQLINTAIKPTRASRPISSMYSVPKLRPKIIPVPVLRRQLVYVAVSRARTAVWMVAGVGSEADRRCWQVSGGNSQGSQS